MTEADFEARRALAAAIYRVSYITGEFTLRSGLVSNRYFDKYRFEARPEILRDIAEHLAPLIPDGTELLAGLEMGGIPVVTALSLHTSIPALFVRKTAKAYGTAKLAEGGEFAGQRVTVVEDICSTGGQIRLSTADLRERGAIVEHALCVIDREQGGEEGLAEDGIQLRSLFVASELEAAAQEL